jgi:BASS family bile acid:Na+ symporter
MRTILDVGVVCVTVMMMGAVGMELEGRQFREVARRKGTLVLTLAVQAVVLPALGFLLIRVMALPAHISAGILLVAACPVGDIANFYTLLARANVPFSVTVNTLSILLSVATMAVTFEAYGLVLGEHFVFAVPTPTLILRLTLMVVLPVLAGMAIRRFRPEFVARHARTLRGAVLGGIASLLGYVMFNQRDRLAADWQHTAAAAAAFMMLALLAGLAVGRTLRLPAGEGVTVGILFAVRNVALASAIAITLLHRIEYAVFAAVYFVTEVPLLLGVVAGYRRWWAPAVQRADLLSNAR